MIVQMKGKLDVTPILFLNITIISFSIIASLLIKLITHNFG